MANASPASAEVLVADDAVAVIHRRSRDASLVLLVSNAGDMRLGG